MTLFHEIYSLYFRIVTHILGRVEITDAQLQEIIQKEGYKDSVLFLPQKLIPQKDGSDWMLLRRTDQGTLRSILGHKPQRTVTKLQKRWLKTKLSDPRMRLFLDDETYASLTQHLSDVPPLWEDGLYCYFDQFSDGDDYCMESYRKAFCTILNACKNRSVLNITFISNKGEHKQICGIPLSIEYSRKNDKFRTYFRCMDDGKLRSTIIVNLGRILTAEPSDSHTHSAIQMQNVFDARQCRKPVTVLVTQERNALERFMMEFAAYKKRTEFDPETGICTVQLWYDLTDETELLIRLLSFGPVLEITAPSHFRALAAERIRKQYALLHGE